MRFKSVLRLGGGGDRAGGHGERIQMVWVDGGGRGQRDLSRRADGRMPF